MIINSLSKVINCFKSPKEEQELINISLEEYDDLFPYIMMYSQNDFFSTLEKYIRLAVIQKGITLSNSKLSLILQSIRKNYYEPEYIKVNQLIQSIDNIKHCEHFSNSNFIPHCNNTKTPLHSCGEKLYCLGTFLLCLKCKLIYSSNSILLQCDYCHVNYYSSKERSSSQSKQKYKPATWAKYHCHAVINDVMKCFKCNHTFYLNMENIKKLYCQKCDFEIDYNKIKWKCVICNEEFTSAAKEYNPIEYKIMKIAVKQALFNAIEAKPETVPCCKMEDSEIQKSKFYHKAECNGILYLGELNKRKVIVCSKCRMLNYYDYHCWMCPKCKERFKLGPRPSNNSISTAVRCENDMGEKTNKISDLEVHKRTNSQILRYDTPISNNEVTSSYINPPHSDDDQGRRERGVSGNPRPMINDEKGTNKLKVDIIDKKAKSPGKNNLLPLNLSKMIFDSVKKIPFPFNMKRKRANTLVNVTDNNSNDNIGISSFDSDEYKIIKEIGEGSHAKIYLSQDKYHQKFAIKKLFASSMSEINKIKSEYNILSTLKQYKLNLVSIYGIDWRKLDKTTYVMYVLMELAERDWEKEIKNRLERSLYYTEEELVNIMTELVATFAVLQRHNISHRDIKPQNILLFHDKSLKISDFGEAKKPLKKINTQIQTLRGTELYMSPVLFNALKTNGISQMYIEHNSFKSDVFSLGLCFLLAATLTFKALVEIREITEMHILKERVEQSLNSRYSNKFLEFLFNMLEINEKIRPDFIELNKISETIFK